MQLLGSAAHKLSYRKDDVKVELPVDAVFEAFAKIIKQSVKSAGISVHEISSVGITSQAQTFAVADENGTFLRPFISWLDMRALETCKTIVLDNFAEHSSIAGIQPNMQICLLKHLLDENPEIVRKKIKIIALPAYLIMLLTGKCVSDNNIAAMSGLFSLTENNYWQSALDLLKIDKSNLPEIVEIGNITGKIKSDNPFDIPAEIPVFSCGNDQTAGAYGAELKRGDILITLGTAQIAYCCCDNMPEPADGLFRGIYPGGLFYAMFAKNGGAIISRVIETFPEFKDFDTFANLAENASVNSGLSFSINDEAEWSDENANLADKALAVFVYLSKGIGKMFAALRKTSTADGEILLAGGGTKNRIWVKLIESEINKKAVIVNTSPCRGIARMISD